MKEMLLVIVMGVVFAVGYSIMEGIDRFLERSREERPEMLERENSGSAVA